MPGPKSTPNGTARDKAKPNRKSAARLAARQEEFDSTDSKKTEHGFAMHRPGSQNRSK